MLSSFALTNKSVVPVFSASIAVQKLAGNRVTFKQLDIEITDAAHGSFDRTTGVFTVKTSGIYLINFNGVGYGTTGTASSSNITLRVNDVVKASSYCYYNGATTTTSRLYGSLSMSPVLKLDSGDLVDVFIVSGSLYEATGVFNSFSAVLLSY